MRISWLFDPILAGIRAAVYRLIARIEGAGRRSAPSLEPWSAPLSDDRGGSLAAQLANDDIDDATRMQLALAWQSAVSAAHRALGTATAHALALTELGAPPDLVAAAHERALDRIRVTKIAASTARVCAARRVQVLGGQERPLGGRRTHARLATEAVLDGALRAGASARVHAKLARRTPHRAFAVLLEEIAAAEAREAAHAWRIVAWCLDEGGAPMRAALQELTRSLPSSIERRLPPDALAGGWERWGIAGSALYGQEHERTATAVERRLRTSTASARPELVAI